MTTPRTVTATLVASLKRAAKRESRTTSLTYSQALEIEAQHAGFSNWHAVTELLRSGSVVLQEPLEIDPLLPPDFYNTPNEERSEEELTRWWQKPFACTNPDGSLDVRCLDGGAWDRPTFYGTATSPEAAIALAEKKLRTWRWAQQQPVSTMRGDRIYMMVMPNRPGEIPVMVMVLDSFEAANAWLTEWQKRHPPPLGSRSQWRGLQDQTLSDRG